MLGLILAFVGYSIIVHTREVNTRQPEIEFFPFWMFWCNHVSDVKTRAVRDEEQNRAK